MGYVDPSDQWNLGTSNANTPPYAFCNGKADGFNLNVVKLTLDKPADLKEDWGAGYKVDLLFGPDANALASQSTGNLGDLDRKSTRLNSSHRCISYAVF